MRNVWNLRRSSEEDAEEPIIELIHAKCSDRPLYPKKAVQLNPRNLHYNELPNFDHEAWQLKLENEAKSGTQMNAAEKVQAKQQRKEQGYAKILEMFEQSSIILSQEQYESEAAKLGVILNDARSIKTKLIADKKVRQLVESKRGGKSLYGNSDAILDFFRNHPDEYKLI